jgi:hypothetical protein
MQIVDAVNDTFGIEIDYGQVISCRKSEITLSTQTEHRPDKESVQFTADQPKEPLFTRIADGEAAPVPFSIARESSISIVPAPVPGGADADGAPATQTGRRQDAESLLDADDAPATQTGHRPDQKTKSILTDEMKAFIVRGLARYETPTRVAASVQAQFGIAIDRRQVFAYDPAGSRPPAQRWIDLHAATRAKFLGAVAEIGIAQRLVRLRMLDRFANRADENNQMERAAAFLVQAAKECGGFYERFQRPKGVAAPAFA